MQFVIDSSNLDAFLGSQEFLTAAIESIVSILNTGAHGKRARRKSLNDAAEIVLDISQLDLQTNGPAIVQQLAKFIGQLLSQNTPVAKIIIEDEWLTNPLILKANAFLAKKFPEAGIAITGKSGQVLSAPSPGTLPSYVQVLPGENPYPTMNIRAFQVHIQSRITDPFTFNQGPVDACGVATYLMQILETQPGLYTALAQDLVTTGRSDRVVPLIGPHPEKISGSDGAIRPSSSGMLISAFNQAETFLAQQGIPVEILGWLKGIINAIPSKAFGEKFDLFKEHVFDDIAGKVANMPRQIVNYLLKSGYKVKKESARMLPMELLSTVLGSSQNPELAGAVADIQRLTYSDLHSETPQTVEGLLEEFRDIEYRLKKGYQAMLLLESQWNWEMTQQDGELPSGLSHYNYCKDFHLYQHQGQNKVKFTIYTWGERFEVKANLTEFAQHYCGVILSKPKALLFSREITTPAEARKIYKERKGSIKDDEEDQHLRKRGRRPERVCNKTMNPYADAHGRDKSPKKQRTKSSHH
jgi:hypothetical protein